MHSDGVQEIDMLISESIIILSQFFVKNACFYENICNGCSQICSNTLKKKITKDTAKKI